MESLMDCKFTFDYGPENPPTSAIFGPNYMAAKMYQCCQTEDLELGKMMLRPSGLFLEDLAKESLLTEEKFGTVKRVFVVCEKDGLFDEDFQRWLIENSQTKEVELILGADHMVMLSKPQEFFLSLQKIVQKHC
ncbi:Methyl esterase [Trema orientale]|uniref:Methyl esterase n=1 Tax=Trema orientale TaxID=63057 RepID=A0A2P5FY49_TREOI|nr:Methyl esterase [Trema orientale]